MIHSLSGGIIKDAGSYTFVKVEFDDGTRWYISDFPVEQGDKVCAPFGKADMPKIGVAVKVENNVSGQVTPIPVKAAKKLISVILTDDDA